MRRLSAFIYLVLALLLTNGTVVQGQGEHCANFQGGLQIGTQGVVLSGDPNNVRSEPTRSSNRVGQIPPGGIFQVLDGPRCADNVTWWLVNYDGFSGWTGEGQANDVWVQSLQNNSDTGARGGSAAQQSAQLTIGTLPDALQGLAFSFGGGSGTCAYVDQPVLSANTSGYEYPSPPVELEVNSWGLYPSPPWLCAPESIHDGVAYAYSPANERYDLPIVGDVTSNTELPLFAFVQPGLWRLQLYDTVFSIQIPQLAPTQPQIIQSLLTDSILLIGFQPNERVVVIAWRDGQYGELELQVNNEGYELIKMDTLSQWIPVIAIGEFYSIYLYESELPIFSHDVFYTIPKTEAAELLYSLYWSN